MSRILSSFALLSALALLAGGCASRTEVILSVETDIPTLDHVEILVIGPTGSQQSATATFGAAPSTARTLGVTWSSGPLAPFVATVTGYRSGAVVITRTAELELVQGQTRVVHVDLLARCVSVVCGAQQTCGDSGCRPRLLGPSDYESYTGSISAHDAGPPSTDDAAMMSMIDAASTPPDTGSGCGNLTSDPNNCGSCGNVCMLAHSTAPTCASGRCQVGTCDTGFDNCDGRSSTGCEASLTTDTQNCGTCGHRCVGAMNMCCNGTCAAGC